MLTPSTSTSVAQSIQVHSILFIEDDDLHFEVILAAVRSCEHIEFSHERARSLSEARHCIAEKHFDLILLDLGLPESKGVETIIRLAEITRAAPVVVITSDTNIDLGTSSLQHGAMDFLSKDEISQATLSRVIRYSLERWRQKNAIEQSLSDLERFGDAVAHDLISPLNSIQGFAKLIELGLEKYQEDEDLHQNLKLLESSTLRAAALVHDLHKFARLGRRAVDLEYADLTEIVSETVDSLQVLIQENGATVRCDSLPTFVCDRGLIAHVLQNLISNAIKYHREGVPPVISISCCEVNKYQVISVSDNGIGIPDFESDRIFQPFERLSHNNHIDGSGLGLAICKRIVEAHRGQIWVDAHEGEGSTFRFYLATSLEDAIGHHESKNAC